MKKKQLINLMILASVVSFSSCDVVEDFERRMVKVNRYEKVSLYLSKENRELKAQVSQVKNELQVLKSESNYLKSQLDKYEGKTKRARSLASVPDWKKNNDLVQYSVYKWSPEQMLSMAEKEFKTKNYEKSAQFFQEFSDQYPKNTHVNDKFLFKAGVAAFESGNHHDWTLKHLDKLVKNYPTSKLYRGAKLWMALTHLKMGDEQKFFNTVEEFRKKYRNTDEWSILSHHYENIVQKYKRN
jgi:outer membrane protein assembly factor BamD (BamD/ComL family)